MSSHAPKAAKEKSFINNKNKKRVLNLKAISIAFM